MMICDSRLLGNTSHLLQNLSIITVLCCNIISLLLIILVYTQFWKTYPHDSKVDSK